MKKLFIFLALAALLASCATLSPNRQKPCGDPVRWEKKTRFNAKRQWMHQRSDGYWVVTTTGFRKYRKDIFECKPDSVTLANL